MKLRQMVLWMLVALIACALTSCSRTPAQPSIVVIVLDTVRRDHTGLGGSGSPRGSFTPELDAFAAENTAFTKAFASAPWTVPSHASMFTGLLPTVHGCPSRNPRFVTEKPSFAELLRDRGYETAAFFSNPFLTEEMTGLMRGFDLQVVSGDPRMMEALRLSDQGGEETLSNVREWLSGRQSDTPFLLFVNILEAHMPYDPLGDYREEYLADLPMDDVVLSEWEFEYWAGLHRPGDVDWRRLQRLYAGDVHHADQLFGRLMNILRESGEYEDTAIIVVSDHGENLGEHGIPGHRFSLHESLLAVPVAVRAPGRLEPGVRDYPVALTDVFTTVLDLATVPVLDAPPHSRSLLNDPPDAPRALIAEYEGGLPDIIAHLEELNPGQDMTPFSTAYASALLGNMRLTIGSDRSSVLHDMDADPFQRQDLSRQDIATVQVLTGLLSEVRRSPHRPVQIDEGMREWLRSLGYM